MTIYLFAGLRELIGSPSITIDPMTTADSLISHLIAQYPNAKSLLERSRVAVNHTFVESDHTVQPGDEIAVIPPVSGG